MFTGLVTGNGGRGCHPPADRFPMIVDGDALGHLLDHEQIPRLQDSMRDFRKLEGPKPIVTVGTKTYSGWSLRLSGDTSSTRLDSMFRFESPP